MPNLQIGIMRSQTQPGDMVIRLNTGGLIGGVISALTNKSQFVHGGLGAGQNRLIEVNGGLNPDSTGKNRILANIYMSDLFSPDLRTNSYVVYRCIDTDLATQVAIQAYPFVRRGYDNSWGYNLVAALKSTPVWRNLFSATTDADNVQTIDANESILDVAELEGKNWFCTQWMVWMYEQVAAKTGRIFNLAIRPKDAYPGALVAALDTSPMFTYQGVIRGIG